MSEYQYYEFRAVSTRAAISRTSFSNYYSFGDLKADARDLLVKYFLIRPRPLQGNLGE